MTIEFLVFLLVGRIFIYLGMLFPPFSESKIELIKRIWSCSLCVGVYVYSFLSFVMGVVLFRNIFYCFGVSELFTGGIVSFVMHLLEIGWREKFSVVVIE